jgi:hypothetical protein
MLCNFIVKMFRKRPRVTMMAIVPLSTQAHRRRAIARADRKPKTRQPPLSVNRASSTQTATRQSVLSCRARQARVLVLASLYAARFQAYIDDLETNHSARVLFMGGIRPGRCSSSSEHPCGKALDVCQRSRGVVDPRCNLPGRVALGRIAASHGLFEGGRWCNSDYGHAQIDVTAAACGDRRVRIVQQQTAQ